MSKQRKQLGIVLNSKFKTELVATYKQTNSCLRALVVCIELHAVGIAGVMLATSRILFLTRKKHQRIIQTNLQTACLLREHVEMG